MTPPERTPRWTTRPTPDGDTTPTTAPLELWATNTATGNPFMRYYVDLERSTTAAETLDWICQVAKKRWADDVTIAGLVRELNRVVNPQATQCSFGIDVVAARAGT